MIILTASGWNTLHDCTQIFALIYSMKKSEEDIKHGILSWFLNIVLFLMHLIAMFTFPTFLWVCVKRPVACDPHLVYYVQFFLCNHLQSRQVDDAQIF